MTSSTLNIKAKIHAVLGKLAESTADSLSDNLREAYHPDAEWRGSHPLNEMKGVDAIRERVWSPLLKAFPDMERRNSIFVGGEYEGRCYIASVGHYTGSFRRPWLEVPPTGTTVYLRFGEVHQIKDGKIVQTTALIDVMDFLRQAGFWPIAPSLGYEGMWPGPITGDGIRLTDSDPEISAASLKQTLAMHQTINTFNDKQKLSRENLLSMEQKDYWHPRMMWHGPSGIGTGRGLEGYVDCHQFPFRKAFPNRVGAGHYIRIGDGNISVTGGWPSVKGLHAGGGWLGLAPTGKEVEMRVMDFYLHHEGLIRENWIPLDIIHVLLQMGVDVLDRVKSQFSARFSR